MLKEIAWIQSHKVRGPVASILGLTELIQVETLNNSNREIFDYIKQATIDLDKVIKDIVGKTNKITGSGD